jgi:nucleoside-diphosphate-sugar epimerase
MRQAGITPLCADITRAEDLARLPARYDWIVSTVSSSRGGREEYRRVFLEGTRKLLAWLAPAPPQKFVYTSSTSVYAHTDGSLVTEAGPTAPASPTAQVLLEAERVLLAANDETGFPAVILRVAGIYGPGRGHLFQQYLRGEARIDGRGDRFLNMVHRDDVVGAILAALQRGQPGHIYNVADDEPVTQLDFFRWLSARLGRPLPPCAPEEQLSARKRAITNKRVSNAALKRDLGYSLKYPTFRAGYTEETAKLKAEV